MLRIQLQPLVAALVGLPLDTDVGNVLGCVLAMAFGFFNNTFAVTDLYCRSMQPIRGMKESSFADQNVLLDYISPDPVTLLIRAVDNGHWRVTCQFLLLSLCQAAPIFAGHVFIRKRQGLKRSLVVDPFNFYTSYGIMWAYVILIPFMRMPASYRAPHRLETAIDIVPYVYHSHLAQLPEFVSQHIDDREAHINSQVILARRRYEFGYYLCEGGRRHMGVAASEIRTSRGPILQPVDKVVVDSEWHRFESNFFRAPRIEYAPYDPCEKEVKPSVSEEQPLLSLSQSDRSSTAPAALHHANGAMNKAGLLQPPTPHPPRLATW